MTKDNETNLETNVNEDLLKFLKFSYFGDLSNPIHAASKRAYRDMNRTIRFNELSTDEIRLELREKVNNVFENEIKKLIGNNITNQKEFDAWHCDVCKTIKSFYLNEGIEFTYGQAQKWINMTIKYLYILKVYSFDNVLKYLHIPVDNYIFDAVEKELEIDRPKEAWSRWDNDEEYKDYQKNIRKELKRKKFVPLRWEFENWLNEAEKEAQKVKK